MSPYPEPGELEPGVVYKASLNPDGSIDSWEEAPPVPPHPLETVSRLEDRGGLAAGGYTPKGRHRATIAGVRIYEAPERATAGPGVELAGERLDRDDVAELIDELGLWLDEVRPGWRER
jgi:hypothetical protein